MRNTVHRPWMLIFSHGYPPLGLYGVARHVERLAHFLSSKGIGVVVITGGGDSLPNFERIAERWLVIRLKPPVLPMKKRDLWRLIWYTLISPLIALKLIRKLGASLIHGNGSYYGGWQASLASFLTRRPFTVIIHGYGIDYYRHHKRPPFALLFLKRAKAIIVQKETAIPVLERWGISRERVFYVEEGAIDIDWFKPPPPGWRKENAERQVAFVGRLTRFKDPLLLIEAAPYILEGYPEARFVFAGDGYLKSRIEHRARELGIDDKVVLLGEVMDVRPIYWSSDVFVATSPYNNFSDLAMLEAMACGMPVVATNSGETHKTIKHGWNGLLVRPGDPIDLAEKVLMLLKDLELAKRLGENARKTVIERYSIEVMGEQMLKVFRKALK